MLFRVSRLESLQTLVDSGGEMDCGADSSAKRDVSFSEECETCSMLREIVRCTGPGMADDSTEWLIQAIRAVRDNHSAGASLTAKEVHRLLTESGLELTVSEVKRASSKAAKKAAQTVDPQATSGQSARSGSSTQMAATTGIGDNLRALSLATSAEQVSHDAQFLTALADACQQIDPSFAKEALRSSRSAMHKYRMSKRVQIACWSLMIEVVSNIFKGKRCEQEIDAIKMAMDEGAALAAAQTLTDFQDDMDVALLACNAITTFRFADVLLPQASFVALAGTLRCARSKEVQERVCDTLCTLTCKSLPGTAAVAINGGVFDAVSAVLQQPGSSLSPGMVDCAVGLLGNLLMGGQVHDLEISPSSFCDWTSTVMGVFSDHKESVEAATSCAGFLANLFSLAAPPETNQPGRPIDHGMFDTLYAKFRMSNAAAEGILTCVSMGAFDLLADALYEHCTEPRCVQAILMAASHACMGRGEAMNNRRMALVASRFPAKLIKLMRSPDRCQHQGAPVEQWVLCCRVLSNLTSDCEDRLTKGAGLFDWANLKQVQERLVSLGVFESLTKLLTMYPRALEEDAGGVCRVLLEDALELEQTAGSGPMPPCRRHVDAAIDAGTKAALALAVSHPGSEAAKALLVMGMTWEDITEFAIRIRPAGGGKTTVISRGSLAFHVDPQAQERAHLQCAKCGARPNAEMRLRNCARCHKTKYCSDICQRADWQRHKQQCVRCEAPPIDRSRPADAILEAFSRMA